MLTDHERIAAKHPNWEGHLVLSHASQTLVLEPIGATATYKRSERYIYVAWDDYPPETFEECDGVYVQSGTIAEAQGLSACRISGLPFLLRQVVVRVPGTQHDVMLRLGTSDIDVFSQVFVSKQYDTPAMPLSCGTIVDLGANIGLSAVFFALRYPSARIVAVEPDAANLAQLNANTNAFGDRVTILHAAAWIEDGEIGLSAHSPDGKSLGEWGFQVSRNPSPHADRVPALTMQSIMARAGISHVDLLKVDIEGAELDLFAGSNLWLHDVQTIVIETHDRFKPGSEDAVRTALAGNFAELPPCGENLIFERC